MVYMPGFRWENIDASEKIGVRLLSLSRKLLPRSHKKSTIYFYLYRGKVEFRSSEKTTIIDQDDLIRIKSGTTYEILNLGGSEPAVLLEISIPPTTPQDTTFK